MQDDPMTELEAKVNAHLASLPPEHRPENTLRRRIQSVAYAGGDWFGATDSDGHITYYRRADIRRILDVN